MARVLMLVLVAASIFLTAFSFANDPANEVQAKTASCCDDAACCRK